MGKKAGSQAKEKSISEKFIDQFYSLQAEFVDEKGEKIEIQDSGFLGLLATGYKGLAVLRQKRGHTYLYAKFTKGKKLVRRKAEDKAPTRTKNK